MKKLFFILFLLLLAFALEAKEVIDIPYLNEQPLIDGFEDNAEWSNAARVDQFYQISPGDNTIPSGKTLAFLGYDKKNLYLMAKCYFDDI